MSDAREVDQLLADEIERRLALLDSDEPETGEVRASMHSLKGSAALAGHADLAIVIAQLGARARSRDPNALPEARAILADARDRLRRGLAPFASAWPEPPPGFGASNVDARYRLDYQAAMRDRLGELDAATQADDGATVRVERAYRSVHAMKGAAGSVGDDATAWYCHGLETWLRASLEDDQAAHDALPDLARHRGILALFLERPEHAIDTLRALAERRRPATDRPRRTAPPPSRPPPFGAETEDADSYLRVTSSGIDRFLEQLERIDLVHSELGGAAQASHTLAARLRAARGHLLEAAQLLGSRAAPGAVAQAALQIELAQRTIGSATQNLERGVAMLRRNAELLHDRASEMRSELSALRRTSVGWMFTRISHAVERLALQEGKLVQIAVSGAELTLDRRLADRLLEPLMQLARNAVAHGLQSPDERAAAGKSPIAAIRLSATRMGDWLRVVIADDGRGVDVEDIRRVALERGAMSSEAAEAAEPEELLSLLFLPGLTTRQGADLLAGRGVGLELAQDAARRLGGAIRLHARPDAGLVATIDVPNDRGVVEVLWLSAAGQELALPVSFTGRVSTARRARPSVHLAQCLGLSHASPPTHELELVIHGVQPISIGVDGVGAIEEAIVRPLPALAALSGPYTGAILRSDGALRLTLDAAVLAARAWARATP